MRGRTKILALTLIIGIIIAAFLAGYQVHAFLDEDNPRFPVLEQAFNILTNHSLVRMPEDPALEYGMIRGMLQASGDENALFLEPPNQELETDSLEGNYGGIGVELVRTENGDILLYPLANSPAESAGIAAGDRLIRAGDLAITENIPLETIQAAIRGDIGETVEITVIRGAENESWTFNIPLEGVALPSVTRWISPESPSTGIIKVNIIAASTSDEILSAFEDLAAQGATGFVLDLRDNGGGLLMEAVDVSRLFLQSGKILEQQYRGQPAESFQVETPGPLASEPVVVLVNNNTASAAEIIAGALQANERAPVIGMPTYGKDSIQLIFNLDDGSSLHITAARWLVPGLEPPTGENGIRPDILISAETPGVDPALSEAIRYLNVSR